MLLSIFLLGLSCGAGDLTIETGCGISLGLSSVMRNIPASPHFIPGVINKCPLEGKINPSLQTRITSSAFTQGLLLDYLVLFCLLIFQCWELNPEPHAC